MANSLVKEKANLHLAGTNAQVLTIDRKPVKFKSELSSLKSQLGAFKLAYRLVTESLFDCKLLQYATKPLWDWYTEQVTTIKTPDQALKYSMSMAMNEDWQSERHLKDLCKCLQANIALTTLQQVNNSARKLFFLVAHLLSNRAWSMAVRHALPPERYATFLHPVHKRSTCRMIREEHLALMQFEEHVADCALPGPYGKQLPSATKLKLKADLQLAINPPSRMIMDAMEAQLYSLPDSGSVWGRAVTPPEHLLQAVLKCFPDNKIAEDSHNLIRQDAKGNVNQKQTLPHIQHVVETSLVLESRGINHNAAIDRESFMRHWHGGFSREKNNFVASGGVLDKEWQKLMGPKNWATYSEESLEKATAAWEWLQHYKKKESYNGNG
eukprot:Skav224994  [mRNA]  locus=scaffold765:35364:36509:- [translate_table: standard]